MKLFKSLLVAPAALGLLSPLTANAAELNLNDVADYSNGNLATISNFSEIYPTDWAFQAITDIATSRGFSGVIPTGVITRYEAASIINATLKDVVQLTEQEQRLINEFSTELAVLQSRVDGLETRMNDFEAGSFSTTTTASFSADFAIGAVDGGTSSTDDAVNAGYGFQIDLNTSFTGEDSLDISIDAGNAEDAGTAEFDLNSADEALTVDGISYTFPLSDKTTVMIGDTVDGSSLFSIACVYGTPSNTMDDCGALNSAFVGSGTTLAASYDFDNGFYTSFGYAGAGDSDAGLMTKEGFDSYGLNAAYTGDEYGISLSYALVEDGTTTDETYTALNAYWTPDGFPSISVGYEWTDDSDGAANADTKTHYFVGVQFEEVGAGTLGFAIGTKDAVTEGNDELLMYEAFYSYSVNDGMTITPLVYVKEHATGTDDETGLMVKTSFSF